MIFLIIIAIISLFISSFFIFKVILNRGKIQENAEKAFAERDWEHCIKLYKKIINEEQIIPLQYFQLGCAYSNINKDQESIKCFHTLYNNHSFDERISTDMVLDKIGDMYLKMDNHDEAVKYYKLYLTERPSDPNPYFKMGKIFFEKEEYGVSSDFLQKTINIKNDFTKAFPLLALIFYKNSRFDDALKYFKLTENADKKNKDVYYYIGDILAKKNYPADAIVYLKLSIKHNENILKSNILLGRLSINLDKPTDAYTYYETALANIKKEEIHINEVLEIKYQFAILCSNMSKMSKAIELWQDIAEVDEGYKDVKGRLGILKNNKSQDEIQKIFNFNQSEFYDYCKKILTNIDHHVHSVNPINKDSIEYKTKCFIRNKEENCLTHFTREMREMDSTDIKRLGTQVRDNKFYKGMFFSFTKVSVEAFEEVAQWPIDLFGQSKLKSLIKKKRR